METKLEVIRLLLIGCFLALLVLVVSGFLYSAVSSSKDGRLYPPPGRLVDVGSHKMHVTYEGSGGPTVLLAAGAGGTVLDWSLVQPLLAKTTTVCSYDRSGLGWSEEGPTPRSGGAIVEELRSLLTAVELQPPYILVGHSFGGLLMQLFAGKYPREVAGLVLVDAVHPELNERMPAALKEGQSAQLRTLSVGHLLAPMGIPRLLFPPLAPRGLPDEYQAAANSLGYRAQTYQTVRDEAVAFDTTVEEVGAAPLPIDLPLVVLSRGRQEPWPPSVASEVAEAVWQELQIELSEQSTNSTHVLVEDSGHYVQIEKPEVVVNAVRELVDQLRGEPIESANP